MENLLTPSLILILVRNRYVNSKKKKKTTNQHDTHHSTIQYRLVNKTSDENLIDDVVNPDLALETDIHSRVICLNSDNTVPTDRSILLNGRHIFMTYKICIHFCTKSNKTLIKNMFKSYFFFYIYMRELKKKNYFCKFT